MQRGQGGAARLGSVGRKKGGKQEIGLAAVGPGQARPSRCCRPTTCTLRARQISVGASATEDGGPGARCTAQPNPHSFFSSPLSSLSPSEETACRFCAAALPDWKGVLTPAETELAGGMPYVAPTMSVTFNGEVREERRRARGERERGGGGVCSRPRARGPNPPLPPSFLTPSFPLHLSPLLFTLIRSTMSSSRAAPAGTKPSSATSAASSASGPTRRWRSPLTAPTLSAGPW